MTAPDIWADPTREFTVADMANMPDDESVTNWMTEY